MVGTLVVDADDPPPAPDPDAAALVEPELELESVPEPVPEPVLEPRTRVSVLRRGDFGVVRRDVIQLAIFV